MGKSPHEGKPWPHDIEAERALLGGLLIDSSLLTEIGQVLKANDFYREAHRVVYSAINDAGLSGRQIDLVTLAGALETSGQLEEVGGRSYLSALTDACPVTTGLMAYADTIREKAQLRRVLEEAAGVTEAVLEGASLEAVYRRTHRLPEVSEPRGRHSSLISAQEGIEALVRHHGIAEEARKNSEHGLVVPSPWPELNLMLGGGYRGGRRPYLIVAQEKVGKTQVLLKILLTAALEGIPSVLFELELNHIQTICRLVGLLSHVNPGEIEQWVRLTGHQQARVSQAMEQLYSLPLWIDGRSVKRVQGFSAPLAKSPREMRGRIETLERTGIQVGALGIDYVQNMSADRPTGDERRDLVEISVALREWATEVNYPVIELAQCLSRKDDRQDVPTAKSIYGSSQFAKDASAVFVADRPPLRKTAKQREEMSDVEKNEAQLILEYSEHGQTGVIQIRHDPVCGDWVPAWRADYDQR